MSVHHRATKNTEALQKKPETLIKSTTEEESGEENQDRKEEMEEKQETEEEKTEEDYQPPSFAMTWFLVLALVSTDVGKGLSSSIAINATQINAGSMAVIMQRCQLLKKPLCQKIFSIISSEFLCVTQQIEDFFCPFLISFGRRVVRTGKIDFQTVNCKNRKKYFHT